MGCLIQITAMSITGLLGEDAMNYAHMLLEQRQVHVIASDAHSFDKRPLILSPAVDVAARILESREEAEAMVIHRPRTILEGKPVKALSPKPIRKKSGGSIKQTARWLCSLQHTEKDNSLLFRLRRKVIRFKLCAL